jgi:hypothetical protein
MTKHSQASKKSKGSGHHRFILSHMISKKPEAIGNPSPTKNYKKSVSPSLVYRPLTLEKRQYVGFKVTYCGKGNRSVNFDRRKLSVILIPDVNYIRSYRPIAGAIARQTRAEVICCAYQRIETRALNEDLMTRLVQRIRFERSKLRSIDILSENDRLFDIFKQRLTVVSDAPTDGVVITTPTEELPSQIELEEAPLSSPDKPFLRNSNHGPRRKKKVQFVQISRESSENPSPGLFKRMLSSIANLFRSQSPGESPQDTATNSSSNFDFIDRTFIINRNMNLSNSAHCDLIAKLMISEESAKH